MEDGVSMRLLAGGTAVLQETAVLQGTAFLARGMVGEMVVPRGEVTAETAVLHETAVLQGTAFLPKGKFFSLFHHFIPMISYGF